MFHRLSFFIIIIIILSSCKTINFPAAEKSKPLQNDSEPFQAIKQDVSPDLPVLNDMLIWIEPENPEIYLSDSMSVPSVVFRQTADSEDSSVSEDEAAENNETYVEKQIEPAVVIEEKIIEEKGTEQKVAEKKVVEEKVPEERVVEKKVTERSLTAPAQEVFLTEAEGLGWILEGYTDENGKKTSHLKYSGREYIGENTVFSFFAYKAGVYNIKIIKNDYSDGSVERQLLRVEVVDTLHNTAEADPAPAVKQNEGRPVTLPEMKTEAAKVETETVSGKDILGEIFSSKELRTASERLAAAGDCAGAAELIRYGIEKLSWDELDYFYFTLAFLYENCTEIRDERAAAEYYKKIVDSYPISNYWLTAKDKLIYLERNFIHIR